MITAFSLTSCDYLDVVPPEQPNIDDAMSSPTRALGFLLRQTNTYFRIHGTQMATGAHMLSIPHHLLTKTGYGQLPINI